MRELRRRQIARASRFDNFALEHRPNPVAEVNDDPEIMRDHEIGRPFLATQVR